MSEAVKEEIASSPELHLSSSMRRKSLKVTSAASSVASAALATVEYVSPVILETPTQKKKQVEKRKKEFRTRHGEAAGEQLEAESRLFSSMVKTQFRHKRVLHPEKNRLLGYWDAISSFALLYTATLTPFETAFLPSVVGAAAWQDPWFIVNRILDVIFFIDMIMQFFIAYQTGNSFAGRVWVEDHRKIVFHYLQSWFALDATTVFLPGGFDVYLASLDVEANGGVAEKMSILRVLRALRLIKLVRLVRASRVFQRWSNKITLAYGTQLLLQCLLLLIFASHWFACIIGLQASLHNSVHDTIAGKNLYDLCGDEDAEPVRKVALGAEFVLAGCTRLSTAGWYLSAFSWSIMILTGTGGTDFYPSSSSFAETLVVTLLVLFGAFTWTYVLALFCDMATNGNPALTRFRQRLDGLNLLIMINDLPAETASRMRSFFQQQKALVLREDAQRSMPLLSLPLQVELMWSIHSHWMRSIWFIKDLEDTVKVKMAMAMSERMLAPSEVAPKR